MRGGRGIALPTLNLNAREECEVNAMPWLLYHQEINLLCKENYHLINGPMTLRHYSATSHELFNLSIFWCFFFSVIYCLSSVITDSKVSAMWYTAEKRMHFQNYTSMKTQLLISYIFAWILVLVYREKNWQYPNVCILPVQLISVLWNKWYIDKSNCL